MLTTSTFEQYIWKGDGFSHLQIYCVKEFCSCCQQIQCGQGCSTNSMLNKGRHGTDPWPTKSLICLLLIQTLTMSFRHVCSCQQASTDVFVLVCSLDATDPLPGWRDGHGLQPTARAMAKINNLSYKLTFEIFPPLNSKSWTFGRLWPKKDKIQI